MKLISCVVFTVISVLTGTADAAITAWTNPVISGASGNGAATPSIAEDIAVGTLGVTIAATAAGAKTYAITSQTTSGKITIAASTGVLSLATGSFDFETAPTYQLVITCTDSSDSGVGTATVTLSITNVIEAPTFAKSQYSVTIPDGSTAGTSLISVSATPKKAGDTITYSITGGNTPAHWKIEANTGKITVNDAVTLDQATLGGYSLTITAGVGGETATTKVWIAVTTCSGVAAIISSGLMMFVVLATQLL